MDDNNTNQDAYTDTTSPVVSQLLVRVFLFVTAFRSYTMIQLDLTNAYLHAPIKDVVYIYIPDGFPGAHEIARLRKAAYGTKQGARRFYDYTAQVLHEIGLTQCPSDPCLFRYLYEGSECFLLQYMDDSLISGDDIDLKQQQKELTKYFDCKFITPKDFLGLDISQPQPGEINLSMHNFVTKMTDVLQIQDSFYGDVLTPGRTDKKTNKDDEHQPNENTEAMLVP